MGKLAKEHKGIDMIYSVAKPAGLLRFDFPLNLFDLMTVYAKKP
jgi:hypothetical protein